MRLCLVLLVTAACSRSKPPQTGAEAGMIDAAPGKVDQVHYYGRWDDMHSAGWPGSAVAARFSGTEIQATIRESGDDWLEITVDGSARPPLHLTNGTQLYTLASGLAPGEHQITIAKRTESFVGTMRFDGFSGATLIDTPRATRTIELIGDSITAGYGVLGTSPCGFNAASESEPHAWGALAARDLDAAHLSIAYSGIGMVRNSGGDTVDTMPVRYQRTHADQAGSQWDFHVVPDVVVIALGTNDFASGDPGQGYVDAYQRFITDSVGVHAPGVPILLATSPMMGGAGRTQMRGYLDAIAAHFADPKITVVEIPQQDVAADGVGCNYHPNQATARKSANALVPAIRSATGW